jgi:hypothetical protein
MKMQAARRCATSPISVSQVAKQRQHRFGGACHPFRDPPDAAFAVFG